MKNSFYTPAELEDIGFKAVGRNVRISRFARFYSPEQIKIGHNVRIDDFCILSGEITLGNFIHISAYCALYGKFGIELHDYSGMSPRCTIFSATDDFSGDFLIGPMLPAKYINVTGGRVLMSKYSQLAAHSVVFPGVTVGMGAAVGAMSLVTHDLEEWKIYKGIPAVFHKDRSRKMLELNVQGE